MQWSRVTVFHGHWRQINGDSYLDSFWKVMGTSLWEVMGARQQLKRVSWPVDAVMLCF